MKKVLLFSSLLIAGLVLSQLLPGLLAGIWPWAETAIRLATVTCLSFIMIHVGLEFDVDKSNLRQYGWDYFVAATAAAFPWVFCAFYFIFVLLPSEFWSSLPAWKEALLASRFSSPTSAGVLFSMLAAAGLAGTWLFRKARILAIFDDLDTVLLMIPLKMLLVGVKWQLAVIVLLMGIQLALAWKFLHKLSLPTSWRAVLGYAAIIVAVAEVIHAVSIRIDASVPIHIEVLLPAFVLGCMIKLPHHSEEPVPAGSAAEVNSDSVVAPDAEGHSAHEPSASEARAGTIISALFMLFVGLSMPYILDQFSGALPPGSAAAGQAITAPAAPAPPSATPPSAPPHDPSHGPDYGFLTAHTPAMSLWAIIGHTLVVTVLCNLGKMFPALCYRRESSLRQRLALAVGMWPRGEVGAGVLVISLGYGIGGPIVTIALLSLALNLVLTGTFIVLIKRLLGPDANAEGGPSAGPARSVSPA